MAGTAQGGKNAAATNKAKYGDDFYKRIGQIGGKKGRDGGFAYTEFVDGRIIDVGRERARLAGAKGGRISRRVKKEEL